MIRSVAAISCRCFPGDSCWPTLEKWQQFNKSIDGRLVATVPLGVPCHEPHYDEELCGQLQTQWTTPEPHYQSSSSIMAPFFANDSCDPFHPVAKPCLLGNYISYAVNVSQPTHVSKALKFAKEHNVRLVIRNTGHDYQGKSTGAGALGLWMHHLKRIEIEYNYSDAFYSGPAITVGAGVQGIEAYEAADRAGYQVVGGECPSVGLAGGYTQGGGHSALSSRFGLAADQTLVWEVVDGEGRHIVATRDNEYSDLYWALSGGGGGTYGVVLSLTAKLHAGTPVSGLNLTFSAEGLDKDTFYDAIGFFNTFQPALADAGAMVISTITNESFILSPLTGPGIPVKDLRSLIQPYTDHLDTLDIKYTLHSAQFPSYLAQFSTMQGAIQVGIAQYGGWLIPRSVIKANNNALTAAYRDIVEDGAIVINVGLNVSRSVAGDVHNAVLPAWRDALIHTTLTTPWEWNAPASMLEWQRKMTEEYVPRLEKLAPNSGAYLNEADFRQPDFQRAFYGDNYGKLRAIKAKYDPHDLFYALTAVGSEDWVQREDGRLCRADGSVTASPSSGVREL
ncbi:hypothetical protein BJY01DRAFT_234168 [Aspergillus pseudoustus]|uniref:FAD-binding PCMH-type domain-containing protein n=1 Tax=Aspergillus pseudoustus TaxID=1810923 RepID=A0ABR4K633_9EURO